MRTGKIKWYNTPQKYGFIIPDDGGGDVLFLGTHAHAAGFVAIHAGQPVRFEARGERVAVMFADEPDLDETYDALARRAIELNDTGNEECREDARLMCRAAALLRVKERCHQ